jgi:hypothetical protein
MVLKQKETWRLMEQKTWKQDHTATAVWSLIKEPKTYVGEKTASSINGAGKTGYLHAKDWN